MARICTESGCKEKLELWTNRSSVVINLKGLGLFALEKEDGSVNDLVVLR